MLTLGISIENLAFIGFIMVNRHEKDKGFNRDSILYGNFIFIKNADLLYLN